MLEKIGVLPLKAWERSTTSWPRLFRCGRCGRVRPGVEPVIADGSPSLSPAAEPAFAVRSGWPGPDAGRGDGDWAAVARGPSALGRLARADPVTPPPA